MHAPTSPSVHKDRVTTLRADALAAFLKDPLFDEIARADAVVDFVRGHGASKARRRLGLSAEALASIGRVTRLRAGARAEARRLGIAFYKPALVAAAGSSEEAGQITELHRQAAFRVEALQRRAVLGYGAPKLFGGAR